MNLKKFSFKWICAAAALTFFVACSSSSGTSASEDSSDSTDIISSDAGNSSTGASSTSTDSSSDSDVSSNSDASDDAQDEENADTDSLSTSEWLKWDVPVAPTVGTFTAPDSAVTIFLSDAGFTVGNQKSKAVNVVENKIHIGSPGMYVVSGTMTDGQILVEAGINDNVELVLNGVNLGNSENSPIFFVSGDKMKLNLADESVNILSDARHYQFMEIGDYTIEDSVPKACVYARKDMTIKGNGTLYVTGNYNNGIHTKTDLVINDTPTIYVNAVNNALKGKKSVRIKDNGNFYLRTGDGSGISSDKEKVGELGKVVIMAGNFKMDVGNAGVKATDRDSIAGGSFLIRTTNGDGLHAGTIDIWDGIFEIEAGDEGFVGTTALNLKGGSASVLKSSKPFVGKTITIDGGDWFGLGGGYDSTSVLNAMVYTANVKLPSEIAKASVVYVKNAASTIFEKTAGKNVASLFVASSDFTAQTYNVTVNNDEQICSISFVANSKVTTTCAQ